MKGTTVEIKATLKGVKEKYDGKLIKRWKYWVICLNNAVGYVPEKHLL
jgi:hypothetical protein